MGISKINLGDVLFSKALQKLLAVLYSHPDQHFYTNELIRLTQSGTGAIQRELAKLTAVELITIQNIGNQKHYQANKCHPLFTDLRNIILKTFGLTGVLQEILIPLAPQIQIAFVYGSVAKQEDSAHSDIDLLLIHENLTYADLFPLLEIAETKLGRKVNPTLYTLGEWVKRKAKNNHFLNQVINQPKLFLIGTEDELKNFG